jgi:hypothetical protein
MLLAQSDYRKNKTYNRNFRKKQKAKLRKPRRALPWRQDFVHFFILSFSIFRAAWISVMSLNESFGIKKNARALK